MAEATVTHRDDSVDRLEAFLALLTTTRGSVAAIQTAIDAENDALVDQVAAGVGRLQGFNQALTALSESFTTAQQDIAGELGTLAYAASIMAEQSLAEARSRLEDAEGRFAAGLEDTRESLDRAAAELAEQYAQAEATVAALEEQLASLQAGEEQAFAELDAGVEERRAVVGQASSDLDAALEGASVYLLEGLEDYLAAAFQALVGGLEYEEQPSLLEAFGDLGRNVMRSLDDCHSVLQSAGEDLIATTDPLLSDAASSAGDLLDKTQAQADRAAEWALQPLSEETTRNIVSMNHGLEITAALPEMVPQLAAARDVAEHVQQMMDAFLL